VSKTQEYIVDAANLITLPDIYIAVKEAIDDPDVNLDEIAEIISFDPAISARLLKIANSSFYGQMLQVDTIKKAVSILGTTTVHDTVLASSVSNAFQSIHGVDYDVVTFWRGSIMRAVVAKIIAHKLHVSEPDRLFILGLLSDIGHMIMSISDPKLMQKILIQQEKTGYPLYLFERSAFGFDCGELAADILETWSLPDSIVTGIRYQNCPEIAPEYKQEAAIMYCASRLHPDETDFPNMIDVETLKQSEIGQIDYYEIRIEAESLYDEALSLFPITPLKQAV
jgi:HD-like signal output (HDOD) protein